jgi:hypothetical protein
VSAVVKKDLRLSPYLPRPPWLKRFSPFTVSAVPIVVKKFLSSAAPVMTEVFVFLRVLRARRD